jgi:hypothetical protein
VTLNISSILALVGLLCILLSFVLVLAGRGQKDDADAGCWAVIGSVLCVLSYLMREFS